MDDDAKDNGGGICEDADGRADGVNALVPVAPEMGRSCSK